MARRNFTADVRQALGEGQYIVQAGSGGAATGSVDTTALDAAIAAAQLIGAGDASAEIDAIDVAAVALTATASVSGDVVLSWDDAQVTTMNQLKRAVEALLLLAQSSGMV